MQRATRDFRSSLFQSRLLVGRSKPVIDNGWRLGCDRRRMRCRSELTAFDIFTFRFHSLHPFPVTTTHNLCTSSLSSDGTPVIWSPLSPLVVESVPIQGRGNVNSVYTQSKTVPPSLCHQPTNRPIDRSTNQSIDQSIDQSINSSLHTRQWLLFSPLLTHPPFSHPLRPPVRFFAPPLLIPALPLPASSHPAILPSLPPRRSTVALSSVA